MVIRARIISIFTSSILDTIPKFIDEQRRTPRSPRSQPCAIPRVSAQEWGNRGPKRKAGIQESGQAAARQESWRASLRPPRWQEEEGKRISVRQRGVQIGWKSAHGGERLGGSRSTGVPMPVVRRDHQEGFRSARETFSVGKRGPNSLEKA
ncbi:hypothetical protein KM043_010651 [Ampulex compressa]|nr:hypothetical protein KM043_010651 [Ampulex compressa]